MSESTVLKLPELCLIVLIGISGSGKSTFAAKHFLGSEVISSDDCRAMVSDNENDLSATKDAFDLLNYIAAKRLTNGRITVIDATSVQRQDRQKLIQMAKDHDVLPVAVVLNMPISVCTARNLQRADRQLGQHVLPNQQRQLKRGLRGLRKEGFRYVYVLNGEAEIEQATFKRQRLWTNRRAEAGPFDIIGDVHGCLPELLELLRKLGYQIEPGLGDSSIPHINPPTGRRVVFVGDLIDRGPDSMGVLKLVMAMSAQGDAICVPGNHDVKLLRKLRGRRVNMAHGLEQTWQELDGRGADFKAEVETFLDGLISHYVFDEGRLVVAHAGMKEAFQGRASGRVRSFALFGETTGESDEFGLPIRYPWAQDYRGEATVVYGHTPVPEPVWLNRTINIDTGCAFGGTLTALRYPELELVNVPAKRTYAEPIRQFLDPEPAARAGRGPGILDIQDVTGKRVVHTELRGNITIDAERSAAALEVMSRFAIDPRWLIYLPPTLAPTRTSPEPGFLERPEQVFADFSESGIQQVICQEKHMGSRAIIIVCRSPAAAEQHFGIYSEAGGVIYTRTGRPFFDDGAAEADVLIRVRQAVEASDGWARFNTDWLCLDVEIMPWSAKAQGLLQRQYAPVAAAGQMGIAAALDAADAMRPRSADIQPLAAGLARRAEQLRAYQAAYRAYCWPVETVADLKIAPFHVLASAGAAHHHKSHAWHLSEITRICAANQDILMVTESRPVDLGDKESIERAIAWWEQLTNSGGEGIVVKPLDFVSRGKRGLVQPAIKCRGQEYLRIIYGPEYDRPSYLAKLRKRGLQKKRSLALREFVLGLEALDRFVAGEPLYRVHECVFAVLALESDPVDPRL